MRFFALATLSALALVASCSGKEDDSGPTEQAEAGAPDVTAGDAAGDAESDAAPVCELAPGPTPLPNVVGKIVIEGADAGDAGDAGAPPTPTGGDEKGRWVYTEIVLYLPALAEGQIDPAASKIEGTGYITVDGTHFEQLTDTVTTLSTTAVGLVTRGNNTRAKGTYTRVSATALTFTTECRLTNAEGELEEVAFSRIDEDHGRLHVDIQSQIGAAKLVVELERRP